MRRVMSVALAVALSMGLSGMAVAKDMKIGVIDIAKVFQQSPKAKAEKAQLQHKFAGREAKFLAANKALKAKMNKLHRDASVMSNSDKAKLQDTIIKERRDLERMGQDLQQDTSLARNQATTEFLTKVKASVAKIAKKDHYDMILIKNTVPYADAKFDITAEVVKDLS